MLIYWYQYARNGKRIEVETDEASIAGHFLHLLRGPDPDRTCCPRAGYLADPVRRARIQRLDLHRRVIAGTGSDMYSAITGAIGALRGYKHGGANEGAIEIIQRFCNPDEAEARHPPHAGEQRDRDRLWPPGLHHLRPALNMIIKEIARTLCEENGIPMLFEIAERIEKVMWDEKRMFPNLDLVQRGALPRDGHPDAHVHPACSSWRAPPAGPPTSSSSAPTTRSSAPAAHYIGPGAARLRPL